MKVAVDTNVLIYFLGADSPWHKTVLSLLKAAEQSPLEIIGSKLLLSEILSFPGLSDLEAARVMLTISQLPLKLHPLAESVLLAAAKLRRHYRISLADAIHIASAIENEATHFVTHDTALIKKAIPGIQFVDVGDIEKVLLA